ncbi:hypothetical protein PV326_013653, partial [Microctonus aethiopoides]
MIKCGTARAPNYNRHLRRSLTYEGSIHHSPLKCYNLLYMAVSTEPYYKEPKFEQEMTVLQKLPTRSVLQQIIEMLSFPDDIDMK